MREGLSVVADRIIIVPKISPIGLKYTTFALTPYCKILVHRIVDPFHANFQHAMAKVSLRANYILSHREAKVMMIK